MKAAVIQKVGEIPVYMDFPDPTPKEGQRLVHVRAASIKNLDKMLAAGTHYGKHYTNGPVVAGVDGVGVLEDGTRVFTGGLPPFGMMAEKTLVAGNFYVPVPDGLDDVTAAALPNPAVSAWLALQWKGQLQKGGVVLILGATGVTGKLAVQLARQLGAGTIIAAGRNAEVLRALLALGADVVVSLEEGGAAGEGAAPEAADLDGAAAAGGIEAGGGLSEGREAGIAGAGGGLTERFRNIVKQHRPDIVLDFCWGRPAECLLEALSGSDLMGEAHTTRYIHIGEMAVSAIRLPGSVLRSAGIELYGQGGGSVPKAVMAKIPTEIIPYLFQLAAEGKIRIDTEAVPLRDVSAAWQRKETAGKRLVVVPGMDRKLQ